MSSDNSKFPVYYYSVCLCVRFFSSLLAILSHELLNRLAGLEVIMILQFNWIWNELSFQEVAEDAVAHGFCIIDHKFTGI